MRKKEIMNTALHYQAKMERNITYRTIVFQLKERWHIIESEEQRKRNLNEELIYPLYIPY